MISWLATAGFAAAAPKIALVKVGEIYHALPASKTLQSSVDTERNEILSNARADAYRSVLKELEELRQGIGKIPKEDETMLEQARRNFTMKRQEALTLQREFQDFQQRKTDEINTRMVAEMEKILAEIHAKAIEIGRSRGYDWVLDADGRTNTGLPFVLYSKQPHDITADVLSALGGPAVTVDQADPN